jgi:CRP/FNR family cyclic AMP-dependent transcriptional regulator
MTSKPKQAKLELAAFDPEEFLARLAGGISLSEYGKGDIIYRQGDPADSGFYLHKGKVKITVVSPQGREAVVAVLNKGDFFGEGSMAGQNLRLATASVMSDCSVSRINKSTFVDFIHNEPGFADLFISYLLARNSRIEADLVDQLFNSSEKRLARTLLLLANFGKDGEPEPVLAKISQETLAEIVGTTRSRVSFFMNKFRRLGLINYNGHIEVHRSLLNVVLHDNPETED